MSTIETNVFTGDDFFEAFESEKEASPTPEVSSRMRRNDALFGAMVGMVLLAILGVQFLKSGDSPKHTVAIATATPASGYANIFSIPSNHVEFTTSQDTTKIVSPAPVTVPSVSHAAAPVPPTTKPAPVVNSQPTPTTAPVPTAVPTATPMPTAAPTATPVPTATPLPTPTSVPTATPTPTITPSPTVTPSPTAQSTRTATTIPTGTTIP